MVQPLDKDIDDKIGNELDIGYEIKEKSDFAAAEPHYLKAWEFFPEPKFNWDSSQITLYTIADFYFEWKKYDKALEWASLIYQTELLPGDGGPFVLVGKIHFEAGNLKLALDNLDKAYKLAGKRAFTNADKKYLEFYKRQAGVK